MNSNKDLLANKKVAILVKTTLKFDGRVIAEIDTLAETHPNTTFKVFLLPDDNNAPISFAPNVSVIPINIFTRRFKFKKVLIPLTTLLYTIRCLGMVYRFKPDIIHVHDSFPLTVSSLYRLIRKCKVIYDDHELFIINPDLFHKGLYYLESKIYRTADKVLVANRHRKRIAQLIYKVPAEKIEVLENYNHVRNEVSEPFHDKPFEDLIRDGKNNGQVFILHQGVINEGRGLKYLLRIASSLPSHVKIVLMGISGTRYQQLIAQYPELIASTINIGFKPYEHINKYWAAMDGALVFYGIKQINNKYCAPNRLYLGLSNAVPLLVNEENPVLSSSIEQHGAGLSIRMDNLSEVLHTFIDKVQNKEFYADSNSEFSFKAYSGPILKKVYSEIIS